MAKYRRPNALDEDQIAAKFNDVTPVWDAALRDEGVTFDMPTEKDAIAVVFKLHRYRKLMHEFESNRNILMDRFIVRRKENNVTIAPKPSFDMSILRTLDGKPVAPVERQFTPEELHAASGISDRAMAWVPKTPQDHELLDQMLKADPTLKDPRKIVLKEHDASKPLFGDDDDAIVGENK